MEPTHRFFKGLSSLARLVVIVMCSAACEGVLVGADPNQRPSTPGSPGDLPGSPGGSNEPPIEGCGPRIQQALLLLGELSFVNSLRDLLGSDAIEGRLLPDAYTKNFTQKGYVANTSLVSSRLDWAAYATRHLEGRALEITDCNEATSDCARRYLRKFAERAFRRPVQADELDDLMLVFDAGSTFDEGVRLALQAILISPSFNHRTEYGALNDEGYYELTPHEVASMLSFMLADTLPDEELLSAADTGALGSAAERERQAERLLGYAEVQDSVEKTLMAAWTLGNLFGKVKDPAVFPEYSSFLASQMYRETELFLKEHLWDPAGGLASVFSSRTSYVNQALADLYGIPFPGSDPSEFVAVELPSERAGLLTQASILTNLSRTDETSVVARGLFVHGPLLCLPRIPSPPEDAIAEIEAQLEHDMSERERAQVRAETVPCNNCHDQFDAFGLLFEHYDAIGKYRTSLAGIPIDASVDFEKSLSFDGTYASAVDFADALAERPEFVECVARHLMAYGTGEEGLRRTDCEVTEVSEQLTPRSTLADVIGAIMRSPTLFVRKAENTP